MILPAPIVTEIAEILTATLFASAVVKSLVETIRSLIAERILKAGGPGKTEASLVAANVQELKIASAEIDDLKQKIDELVKKNEALAVRFGEKNIS